MQKLVRKLKKYNLGFVSKRIYYNLKYYGFTRPYSNIVRSLRDPNYYKYNAAKYKDLLLENTHGNGQIISLGGKSRYVGSASFNMAKFFDSILKQTSDLSKIEVVFAVDPDDELEVFVKLKKKYGKLFKLIFIIAPQRYGYRGLNLYDKLIFQNISPNSQAYVMVCDDIYITLKHYDTYIQSVLERYKDGIFLIGGLCDTIIPYRMELAKLYGAKEPMCMHAMFTKSQGVVGAYPCFGTKLLKLASEALETTTLLTPAQKQDWSPIGNSPLTDMQIDVIFWFLLLAGYNRYVTKHIVDAHPLYVRIRPGAAKDSFGFNSMDWTFLKFLNSVSLAFVEQIVELCVKHICHNQKN